MKGLNVKKLMKKVNVENVTIVVLLVILVVLVVRYVNDKNNENSEVKKENFSNKNVTLNFFYVDWCPHCKTAKPVIAEFKKQNPDVNVNEINCEKPENKKLVEENDIEGYPTVKASNNKGEDKILMKNVTLKNLSEFVNNL